MAVDNPLIATAVVVALAALAYTLVVRLGRRYVRRVGERSPESAARAKTMWTVLRRVILTGFLVTVVLIIFDIWQLSLTPFVALGTVIGAAIGFGAQDVIKDMLAGFFILAEDQFHVGDVIRIADTTGLVEDIQLRVTVLRDLEGNAHYVPNGQITVTSNYTSLYAQPVVDVSVSYDTDVDRALAILADELSRLIDDPSWSEKITGEVEVFGVEGLTDSAVILRARLKTLPDERWAVRREALRRVKIRFDAEGITIPFPQVTVHHVDGSIAGDDPK